MDLNVGTKILKLLEENIRLKFHDLGLGNSFLDMTPETQVKKAKIDKLDFTKIKHF